MIRSLPLLAAALVLALAAPAHAASKSCLRDGGKLLAASGSVRVVSVKEKPSGNVTRRDRIYGCWVTTGRRFTMFESRDFGLDEIERDSFTIVDQRYAGALMDFEGGASEARSAATFDVKARKALHDTGPCDEVDSGDFSGVDDVAFLPKGGLAYSCNRLRIADSHGDRQLEPPGTDVRDLAVGDNSFGFNARLYWTVVTGMTETLKSLDL
jgi:hypothetical protein